MRRREFIALMGASVTRPFAAMAQEPGRTYRLGVLAPACRQTPPRTAFYDEVNRLGFVEGKNFTKECREFEGFEGDSEVASQYAADLVESKVDGGNITGMFLDLPELIGKQLGLLKEIVSPELIGKQLGLLKEIVPRLSRIAIIGIPGVNAAQFEAAQMVAGAVGIEAKIMEVHVADDFEGALEASRTGHVDAGILLSSPLVYGASKQIGELAIAKRLPLISLFAVFPQSGGLISYGPNVGELFRRCGDYVAKILHGAKPSDLPIQRPEKFDLVINLKTATALGVDIPTHLQQLADDVIE
jgi:ABC-type uncharacterized transport system substrate-binding protein